MKAKVLVDNITKNQWKAEWGLSIYIEYNGHRILLDTGTTEAFAENADQLSPSRLWYKSAEALERFVISYSTSSARDRSWSLKSV